MRSSLVAMPGYEAYKDSGVEWIGMIPDNWDLVRVKHVTSKIGSGITPTGGGTTYLDEGIPLLRSQNVHFGKIELKGVAFISQKTHDQMGNSKVRSGDVLLNITGGSIGRCHYVDSNEELNVNQHVCIVRPNNKMATKFLNSVLASEIGQGQIWFFQQGGGREGLNFEAIKNFFIPLPPAREQTAIAAFLDLKTAKIDQAMAIKEQQIALLKERKQILIQNAVTRGLNPDAPLRDSGVEWVGEIPAHWELKPLVAESTIKSVTNCSERELLSVYLELGVVRFSDVDQKRTNATSSDLSKYQAVDPGDFVLNNQQAWRGSVGVSKYVGIVSPAYIVLTLSDKLYSDYANYLFRTSVMVAHYLVASKGVGTIQRNLYWPQLKRSLIFIPPIHEQVEIVDFVDSESEKIDKAIDLQQQQIDRLKEYKATLINSAVTGKIKVPGVVEPQQEAMAS